MMWGFGAGLVVVLGAAAVGAGGCELVAAVDRSVLNVGGGAPFGGAGGTAGAGGVACDPALCPGGTNECQVPICTPADVCGIELAAAKAPCADLQNPAGQVCDAEGSCVECVDQAECTGTDLCEGGSCVPETCTNLALDGDETDIDCGGSCAPCANGDDCLVAGDCESGFCDALVCAACTLDVDCGTGNYCDAGSCAPKKPVGTACAAPNECGTGFCPGEDLVCCDALCDGTCEACLAGKNGGAGTGTCGPVPAAADPDTECAASSATCRLGGCNGSGQCSPSPDGTVCRTGSGDSCDPNELCAGGSCPADTVAPGSTVCRTGSGDSCDPDEHCPGVAGQACPVDTVAPASTVCHPLNGECDVAENCPGAAGQTCPTDGFVADGQPGAPNGCTNYLCDGLMAACPNSCVDSSDCVVGRSCNGGGKCM